MVRNGHNLLKFDTSIFYPKRLIALHEKKNGWHVIAIEFNDRLVYNPKLVWYLEEIKGWYFCSKLPNLIANWLKYSCHLLNLWEWQTYLLYGFSDVICPVIWRLHDVWEFLKTFFWLRSERSAKMKIIFNQSFMFLSKQVGWTDD